MSFVCVCASHVAHVLVLNGEELDEEPNLNHGADLFLPSLALVLKEWKKPERRRRRGRRSASVLLIFEGASEESLCKLEEPLIAMSL